MLSHNLEQSLHKALAYANERRHEFATLEHLLLALSEDADAVAVMRACGVKIDRLRQELIHYLDGDLAGLVSNRGEDAKPTAGFQRVLQRAAIHVQSSGRDEVTGANVLVALFSERESHAVYFLQQQEMSRLDAVNYISHGIATVPGLSERQPIHGADEDVVGDRVVRKGHEALDAYCVNLNEKAAKGRIDPLIGREAEVERTIQILCRRTKNNPLYVGEPGVGKTRFVRELISAANLPQAGVLTGECYAESGPPYAPLAQMVRDIYEDASHTGTNLPDETLRDLLPIIPSLRSRLIDVSPDQNLDPGLEQQRAFEGFVAFGSTLCSRGPLLLFIDDVHWADTDTLFLLRNLARRGRKLPLLIVMT